jgi:hypothetical protein
VDSDQAVADTELVGRADADEIDGVAAQSQGAGLTLDPGVVAEVGQMDHRYVKPAWGVPRHV